MGKEDVQEIIDNTKKNKEAYLKLKQCSKIDFEYLFQEKFILIHKTTIPEELPLGVYSVETGSPVPWHHTTDQGVIDIGSNGKMEGTTLSIEVDNRFYVDVPLHVEISALEQHIESGYGEKLSYGYYLAHTSDADNYVLAGIYRDDGYWIPGISMEKYFQNETVEFRLEFDITKFPLTTEAITESHQPKHGENVILFVGRNEERLEYKCVKGNFGFWYLIANEKEIIRIKAPRS